LSTRCKPPKRALSGRIPFATIHVTIKSPGRRALCIALSERKRGLSGCTKLQRRLLNGPFRKGTVSVLASRQKRGLSGFYKRSIAFIQSYDNELYPNPAPTRPWLELIVRRCRVSQNEVRPVFQSPLGANPTFSIRRKNTLFSGSIVRRGA
jgi:hypothetical protein